MGYKFLLRQGIFASYMFPYPLTFVAPFSQNIIINIITSHGIDLAANVGPDLFLVLLGHLGRCSSVHLSPSLCPAPRA